MTFPNYTRRRTTITKDTVKNNISSNTIRFKDSVSAGVTQANTAVTLNKGLVFVGAEYANAFLVSRDVTTPSGGQATIQSGEAFSPKIAGVCTTTDVSINRANAGIALTDSDKWGQYTSRCVGFYDQCETCYDTCYTGITAFCDCYSNCTTGCTGSQVGECLSCQGCTGAFMSCAGCTANCALCNTGCYTSDEVHYHCWGNCLWDVGGTCEFVCAATCHDHCQGCAGMCTNQCNEGCAIACQGCTSICQGGCTTGCASGCTSNCVSGYTPGYNNCRSGQGSCGNLCLPLFSCRGSL